MLWSCGRPVGGGIVAQRSIHALSKTTAAARSKLASAPREFPLGKGTSDGSVRRMSTSARTDGFHEALPRRDLVAPAIALGIWGFSWWGAEEGRVQPAVDAIDLNTNPDANPTPKQMLGHFWPFIAGTFAMLFESVACKFAQTADMKWLCTTAINDDFKALTALGLLMAPAEHSPAFVRAIVEQGTMERVKQIFQIYKTLPRDQHDDVLTNACMLAAKVAAQPDLRQHGLSVSDFAWMIPDTKAYSYAPYGVEGLAHLWQSDVRILLKSGGLDRLGALSDGTLLQPRVAGATVVDRELAGRLLGRICEQRESILDEARQLEAQLIEEERQTGPKVTKRTIWQATGVYRGETELELLRRERHLQLASVQQGSMWLQSRTYPAQTIIETYGAVINVASAALLGFAYGSVRAYFRGWSQDVTPSVCRELSMYVGKRTMFGAALLVATFEAAPLIKKMVLEQLGKEEVKSYQQEGALEQLICIDAAYVGALALINFCFPFVLLPVALNPTQLILPPADCDFPRSQKRANSQ